MISTGFPLEVFSTNKLIDKKWITTPNIYYYETESKKEHEIDLLAIKPLIFNCEINGNVERGLLRQILIIECKKSTKKNWVFFIRDISEDKPFLITSQNFGLGHHKNIEDDLYCPDFNSIIDLKMICQHRRKKEATNYCVPFTSNDDKKDEDKNEEGRQIYKAIKSVYYALKFTKTNKDSEFEQIDSKWPNHIGIDIYYPVIIFEGNLFEAKHIGNNEFEINCTDYVDLCWHSPDEELQSLSIDVVHKDFLELYLNSLEKDFNYFQKILNGIKFIKKTGLYTVSSHF